MRKIFVQLVLMTVCTLGAGVASAQTDAQPEFDRNKQDQTERKQMKSRKEKKHNSKKHDASSKDTKRSETTEADPDAPQNRVEMEAADNRVSRGRAAGTAKDAEFPVICREL